MANDQTGPELEYVRGLRELLPAVHGRTGKLLEELGAAEKALEAGEARSRVMMNVYLQFYALGEAIEAVQEFNHRTGR